MAEEKPKEEPAEEPEAKEEPKAEPEETPKEDGPTKALSLQESGAAAEAALDKGKEEKPPEEAEEKPEEEVEDEGEVIVPAIIKRRRPELEALWESFAPEQRESITASVEEQLVQAGKVETVDGQQGTQDRANEPETPTEPEKAVQPSQPDASEPDVVSDDAVAGLLGFLDGEAEAQASVKALVKGLSTIRQDYDDLAKKVVDALDEQGIEIVSIKDAKALESALVEHEGDFTMAFGPNYTQQDVAKMEAKAKEIVKAGRVADGNWSDAVSLALHEKRANTPPEEQPQQLAAKARQAKQASSLGSSPRSERTPERHRANSITEAGNQAEAQLAAR